MLNDATKLQLLFEMLEELSSAKGHRDHYQDLYSENRKAVMVRTRQLETAMALLKEVEFSAGVMGVCPFCGYSPHSSTCTLLALKRDVSYAKEIGRAHV